MPPVVILEVLPPSVWDVLQSCPESGSGGRLVHRWLIQAANHLRHYVSPGEAAELLAAHISRRPKRAEIEQTIAKAYGINSNRNGAAAQMPQFEPDLELIDSIMAEANSCSALINCGRLCERRA
jgi:hypothetical protein